MPDLNGVTLDSPSAFTQLPFLREAPTSMAAGLPNGEHIELEGGSREVPADVLTQVLAEFFTG